MSLLNTNGSIVLGGVTSAGTTYTFNTYSNFSDDTTYEEGNIGIKKQTRRSPKDTTPKVFFRFVKKNLKPEEINKIQKRLILLRDQMEEATLNGQHGLTETCMRAMVLAARELEIHSILKIPVRKISRKIIEKYMHRVVADSSQEKSDPAPLRQKVLHFNPLSQFPRAIPEDVTQKLRDAKRANLFDEYLVLYLDYTKEATSKSTADKVREKDPVLFGVFKEHPDTLYFIADWVDEVCDLTFDQILEKMTDEITEPVEPLLVKDLIRPNYIKQLQKQLEENESVLRKTNANNWKENEVKLLRQSKLHTHISLVKEQFKKTKVKLKTRWDNFVAYVKAWKN